MRKDLVMAGLPVVAGCILGVVLLWSLGSADKIDFEEVALGSQTTGVDASCNGYPIRCGNPRGLDYFWRGWRKRGSRPYVLLMGNSQLHAINQIKAGDLSAPRLLFDHLDAGGVDLCAFTVPNATLTELYVVFEYIVLHKSPESVIVEVCFDDTRNEALRAEYISLLSDPSLEPVLRKTGSGKELLKRYPPAGGRAAPSAAGTGSPDKSEAEVAGLSNSLQEPLELYLNRIAGKVIPGWGGRSQMRGDLFLSLYKLRNRILGITPQSKRRMIRPRYMLQMEALKTMLQRCADLRIKALVYIPPLRDDLSPPYVDAEYLRFKQDVAGVADACGAWYRDFEHLVPGRYWGKTNSTSGEASAELDFMHFQGYGHKLLAGSLARTVDQMLAEQGVNPRRGR